MDLKQQHSSASQHEKAMIERRLWDRVNRDKSSDGMSRTEYLQTLLGADPDEVRKRSNLLKGGADPLIWEKVNKGEVSLSEAASITRTQTGRNSSIASGYQTEFDRLEKKQGELQRSIEELKQRLSSHELNDWPRPLSSEDFSDLYHKLRGDVDEFLTSRNYLDGSLPQIHTALKWYFADQNAAFVELTNRLERLRGTNTQKPLKNVKVKEAFKLLNYADVELSNPPKISEAKKRYAQLVFQHHPDRSGVNHIILDLNEAWKILLNFYERTQS